MSIHPRLIDGSEESTRALWLANTIIRKAKQTLAWQLLGTLSVDLHRAPFPITREIAQEMVRWSFDAGWPYASWHHRDGQTWLILAREADTVAESLERFWRLELQSFERPADVDFHTMTCAIAPSRITAPDWLHVHEKLLLTIAAPDRTWSQIRADTAYRNDACTVYRYRVDLLHAR